MDGYYNILKRDICKLGVALITLIVCLNLAVSTLNNGTRKLYEAAEKYGIELNEPTNIDESVSTHKEAPFIQNDVSIKFEISLVSISLAGLVPVLLLAVKKAWSRLMQKRNIEAKENVEISKL